MDVQVRASLSSIDDQKYDQAIILAHRLLGSVPLAGKPLPTDEAFDFPTTFQLRELWPSYSKLRLAAQDKLEAVGFWRVVRDAGFMYGNSNKLNKAMLYTLGGQLRGQNLINFNPAAFDAQGNLIIAEDESVLSDPPAPFDAEEDLVVANAEAVQSDPPAAFATQGDLIMTDNESMLSDPPSDLDSDFAIPTIEREVFLDDDHEMAVKQEPASSDDKIDPMLLAATMRASIEILQEPLEQEDTTMAESEGVTMRKPDDLTEDEEIEGDGPPPAPPMLPTRSPLEKRNRLYLDVVLDSEDGLLGIGVDEDEGIYIARCQKNPVVSGGQCRRAALAGSNFCWQHEH